MDDLYPIGTWLYHTILKKFGKVVGYNYYQTGYDIDIDSWYYWENKDVVKINNDEELLLFKIKYG